MFHCSNLLAPNSWPNVSTKACQPLGLDVLGTKYVSWLVLIRFGIGVNIKALHDMRAIKMGRLLVLVQQIEGDIVKQCYLSMIVWFSYSLFREIYKGSGSSGLCEWGSQIIKQSEEGLSSLWSILLCSLSTPLRQSCIQRRVRRKVNLFSLSWNQASRLHRTEEPLPPKAHPGGCNRIIGTVP